MFDFHFIPPPALQVWWPQITTMLLKCEETWAEYETIESIRDAVLNENLILGVTHDNSAAVFSVLVSIRGYHLVRTLHIVWCYGPGLDEHIDNTLSAIEQFAAVNDCQYVSVEGRSGWTERLKRFGYGDKKVVLRKRISRQRMN